LLLLLLLHVVGSHLAATDLRPFKQLSVVLMKLLWPCPSFEAVSLRWWVPPIQLPTAFQS
jgi:hypothetical protein